MKDMWIKKERHIREVTLGVHSGKPSPPAGLLLLEGPSDRGGCRSGGLTLI